MLIAKGQFSWGGSYVHINKIGWLFLRRCEQLGICSLELKHSHLIEYLHGTYSRHCMLEKIYITVIFLCTDFCSELKFFLHGIFIYSIIIPSVAFSVRAMNKYFMLDQQP